jgi:hypothetical protein
VKHAEEAAEGVCAFVTDPAREGGSVSRKVFISIFNQAHFDVDQCSWMPTGKNERVRR